VSTGQGQRVSTGLDVFAPGVLPSLADCEDVIARGLTTFVEVGQALATIRDERLYRGDYASFEDYCQGRWGFSRVRAHQMIDASKIVQTLTTVNTDLPPIESERQARALGAVVKQDGPEAAAEVLEEVAAEGPVTAAAITTKAEEVRTRTTTTTVTDPAPKKRRPLTDQAKDASYDLLKACERLQRITNDDRMPRNAEQVRDVIASDLRRAIQALTTALEQLNLEGSLP
jgi:hypothetical protein